MTLEEVIAKLDAGNPFYEAFVDFLKSSSLIFERKGANLVEVVETFCNDRRWPVVDKKLGIVFGSRSDEHEMLRGFLYSYHEREESVSSALAGNHYGAGYYMTDGMGYYFSSMRPGVLITVPSYRPDRWDRDLFLLYKVQTL